MYSLFSLKNNSLKSIEYSSLYSEEIEGQVIIASPGHSVGVYIDNENVLPVAKALVSTQNAITEFLQSVNDALELPPERLQTLMAEFEGLSMPIEGTDFKIFVSKGERFKDVSLFVELPADEDDVIINLVSFCEGFKVSEMMIPLYDLELVSQHITSILKQNEQAA